MGGFVWLLVIILLMFGFVSSELLFVFLILRCWLVSNTCAGVMGKGGTFTYLEKVKVDKCGILCQNNLSNRCLMTFH